MVYRGPATVPTAVDHRRQVRSIALHATWHATNKTSFPFHIFSLTSSLGWIGAVNGSICITSFFILVRNVVFATSGSIDYRFLRWRNFDLNCNSVQKISNTYFGEYISWTTPLRLSMTKTANSLLISLTETANNKLDSRKLDKLVQITYPCGLTYPCGQEDHCFLPETGEEKNDQQRQPKGFPNSFIIHFHKIQHLDPLLWPSNLGHTVLHCKRTWTESVQKKLGAVLFFLNAEHQFSKTITHFTTFIMTGTHFF